MVKWKKNIDEAHWHLGKKSKYMYVKLCAVYSQMGIRVRLNNTKIIKAEFKSDLSIYIK